MNARAEDLPVKPILEAAIMAADAPVPLERLLGLFSPLEEDAPGPAEIEAALAELREEYAERGVELVSVAGGYRFQTQARFATWINRLWEERKPRYSRALLETLAIIAYRQPITRGEVEDIRGVAVSTGIIKTLQDREWIKVVGHRDVPGRPAIYATTRQFLDYFNLSGLDALPTLAELRDFDDLNADLFAETGVRFDAGEEVSDDPGSTHGEDRPQEALNDGEAVSADAPAPADPARATDVADDDYPEDDAMVRGQDEADDGTA